VKSRSASIRLAALLAVLLLVVRMPTTVRQAYADVGVWNLVTPPPTFETLYSVTLVSPTEGWAVSKRLALTRSSSTT
jgi:hypothetical protein